MDKKEVNQQVLQFIFTNSVLMLEKSSLSFFFKSFVVCWINVFCWVDIQVFACRGAETLVCSSVARLPDLPMFVYFYSTISFLSWHLRDRFFNKKKKRFKSLTLQDYKGFFVTLSIWNFFAKKSKNNVISSYKISTCFTAKFSSKKKTLK